MKQFFTKWWLSRMAAQEFYFKQEFNTQEDYKIVTFLIALQLYPLELTGMFVYIYFYGSLKNVPIFHFIPGPFLALLLFGLNYFLAWLYILPKKKKQYLEKLYISYTRFPLVRRKRLYSFVNGIKIMFLYVLLPWSICIITLLFLKIIN